MNDYTVVMLEKVTALALRMRKILESSKICVVDTNSEDKLFNTIYGSGYNVSLVILDLEITQDYAMDLLIETRNRLNTVPIIVLSSGGKKEFFVEAMLQGATDFIIKPFQDQTLISKVFKYLIPEESTNAELVTLDLKQYIKGELRKAEKGSFPISIMFLNFENNSTKEIQEIETTSFIFENMKDLFWDTDIFIRFASKNYLGIFPFCNEKNTKIINKKLSTRFEELKQKNKLINEYNMISIFVSYPFDTNETSKVYDILISRISEKFKDIQLT